MRFGFQSRNAAPSPRAPNEPASPAIGEIDTKAPFESVKAAVNLFIEASPKADKPVLKKSTTMEESVLGKETQLHRILKEIDKYKQHVKIAESTKCQAIQQLEKANTTFKELTNKLETTSESKQASVESTEAAKSRTQQIKSTKNKEARQQVVDDETNMYKAAADELISTKQQLNNLKQDYDIALEAKLASFQGASEALKSEKVNHKKIIELSKNIDHMNQTLERVKIVCAKAEEDHVKLMEEKEGLLDSKKKAKDDVDLKIQCLRKDVEEPENIKKRVEETSEAVNLLRDQLKQVRTADMEALRNVNLKVDEAKKRLEEMKEEERSLRGEVDPLKQQLEQLQVQEVITEKSIESKISEMWLEAEKARHEEKERKREMEKLLKEAQRSEVAIKEAETKLEKAQRGVEEAEAAKELADDQIRERKSSSSSSSMKADSNTVILTTNDFEALSRKAEEATSACDTKVETIMDQLETMKQKERGILQKLEKSMQQNKEIEAQINKAHKTAEVADAARQTVQSELNKWRQQTKRSY